MVDYITKINAELDIYLDAFPVVAPFWSKEKLENAIKTKGSGDRDDRAVRAMINRKLKEMLPCFSAIQGTSDAFDAVCLACAFFGNREIAERYIDEKEYQQFVYCVGGAIVYFAERELQTERFIEFATI
ncbi:hypothetical protein FACS1894188_01730 [Clostridia bacterium]|nr:hypothetical protein FACS1894188_01730 [Clostridia bacterium]